MQDGIDGIVLRVDEILERLRVVEFSALDIAVILRAVIEIYRGFEIGVLVLDKLAVPHPEVERHIDGIQLRLEGIEFLAHRNFPDILGNPAGHLGGTVEYIEVVDRKPLFRARLDGRSRRLLVEKLLLALDSVDGPLRGLVVRVGFSRLVKQVESLVRAPLLVVHPRERNHRVCVARILVDRNLEVILRILLVANLEVALAPILVDVRASRLNPLKTVETRLNLVLVAVADVVLPEQVHRIDVVLVYLPQMGNLLVCCGKIVR